MPNNESKAKDVIEAVEGLTKAVPIYQDGLQPAVRELGTSLETVAKTVNLALSPLRVLIWGVDQLQGWIDTHIAEKLRHVPREYIKTPATNIAGPTLEAMKFTGDSESLRELYANLLARSMDVRTARDAHPAFVEIIKQLTPDEARILKHIAREGISDDIVLPLLDIHVEVPPEKLPSQITMVAAGRNFSALAYDSHCECPSQGPVYIDNLCRLGVLEFDPLLRVADHDAYDRIRSQPDVVKAIDCAKHLGRIRWQEKSCHITPLGRLFLKACVIDPGTSPLSPDDAPPALA